MKFRKTIAVPNKSLSNEFKENTKGKSLKTFNETYNTALDSYMIKANIIGVDENYYKEILYKEQINDDAKVLVVNLTKQTIYESTHKPKTIPFFNSSLGNINLYLGKDNFEKIPTKLILNIPEGLDINLENFSSIVIMPFSFAEEIADKLEKADPDFTRYYGFYLNINDASFEKTASEITSILKESKHADNIRVSNAKLKNKENAGDTAKMVWVFGIVLFIIFLLCIINAYAAITSGMQMRKKEIAIAVSIGLSQKGLQRLVFKEALLNSILPILKSIPFSILYMFWFSNGVIICTMADLFANINYIHMLAFMLLISISIFLIYRVNIKPYKSKKPIQLIGRSN